MSSIIISKSRALSGTVNIGGSKNAALPIIFSTLTVCGTSRLTNVPDISDVRISLKILSKMGADIKRCGDTLFINTDRAQYKVPDVNDVNSLRASSYLIGAMLARFRRAPVMSFGGCNFEPRPIDMHIDAAAALGASLDGDTLVAKVLKPAEIRFSKVSVGATVNSIIMAASIEGVTRIYGGAVEPHVMALVDFLRSAGARITCTNSCIEVEGGALREGSTRIIPDMIEAGTYLSLSLLTGGSITVRGADHTHLSSFFDFLAKLGVVVEYDGDTISVTGVPDSYAAVVTGPYPQFPTDLQPIVAPLLAVGEGGRITEGIFHNRFGYLRELSRFGLRCKIYSGYADVYKSVITPAEATAPDLRGGAALLLLALFSDGESVIHSAQILKRGYENLVNKLTSLGVDIKERDT